MKARRTLPLLVIAIPLIGLALTATLSVSKDTRGLAPQHAAEIAQSR